jgi:hypothetical protein
LIVVDVVFVARTMKEEEEDTSNLSRVERSLKEGYWYFPLEPTSDEICAALRARNQQHYEDGYPDNLVSLNRFFVMHKVGYRNGKGVKLEGIIHLQDNFIKQKYANSKQPRAFTSSTNLFI